MNLILTLTGRDLRVMPRRGKWRRLRMLVVLGCALILLIPYLGSALQSSTTRGLALFQFLCPIAVLLAIFTAPLMAGTAVAHDREAHTLELLCLTPASSWQLIAGRVLGAVVQASLVGLSLLPLLMLCISMGGVSANQILLAGGLVLSVIFAASCLGILVALAVPSRWPQEVVIMLAAGLFFLALPLGPLLWLDSNWFSPVYEAVQIMSPAFATSELVTGGDLTQVVANCVWLTFSGAIMAWLACGLLRRRVILGDEAMLGGTAKVPTQRPSRQFDHNPMRERDYYCAFRANRSGWWIVGLTLLSLAVFTGGACYLEGGLNGLSSWDYNAIGAWVLAVPVFLWAFLFVWRCAHAFAQESRQGAVDMMLLTDLSPDELESGKRGAIVDSLRPGLWTVCLTLLCYLAVLEATTGGDCLDEMQLTVFLVVYALLSAYAGGCLAIYLSLRIGRFAFVTCLVALVGVMFVHAFGLWPLSALIALLMMAPCMILNGGDIPEWLGRSAIAVGAVVQLAILIGVSYLFQLHTRFHLQQLTHRPK